MGMFRGRLQMPGVVDRPLDIVMDLDRERMTMTSSDGTSIGSWPLESVRFTGRDDGFIIQIYGVPATVSTENDGAFASEVGLRWAPPRLRRLMALNLRQAEKQERLEVAAAG